MDSFTSNIWTGPFTIEGVPGQFLLLPYFIEICVFNANGVDLDQMLHFVLSDLGLNCLPMSLFLDIMHKWLN